MRPRSYPKRDVGPTKAVTQPAYARGRRRRISGYERRWAAILPTITGQRTAAVNTDHNDMPTQEAELFTAGLQWPVYVEMVLSGVFFNIS